MSINSIEFASLRDPQEMRDWLHDNNCPEHIARRVIEQRTKQPGFRPAAQAHPLVDTTLRDKVVAGGLF
jgi:hypothetical protein